jgi:hypothetical protein
MGARALPATVNLLSISFSDGGSATGEFALNSSGYLTTPTLVVTTAGSALAGATYTLSGPSLFSATSLDVTLPSPPAAAAYMFGLHLVFAQPLGSVTMDRMTGASCEFTGYVCTAPGTRFVVSGFAVVPESGSITLLGSGLLGLGAAQRRWGV